MNKGTSQAMWIVIAIVVALVVALVVVIVFSSTSGSVDQSNKGVIDNARTGIDAQLCSSMCDACKQTYGINCNWADYRNGKCETYTDC